MLLAKSKAWSAVGLGFILQSMSIGTTLCARNGHNVTNAGIPPTDARNRQGFFPESGLGVRREPDKTDSVKSGKWSATGSPRRRSNFATYAVLAMVVPIGFALRILVVEDQQANLDEARTSPIDLRRDA